MKGRFRFFICIVLVLTLACACCLGVAAAGMSDKISDTERVPVISYGLRVLASQTDMRVTGIDGQILNFTEECFMRGMNLSEIESIRITELPDGAVGTLSLGAESMKVGQVVSGDDIAKMTFSQSGGKFDSASFKFSVNGSAYENECKIFMISSVNSAPTTGNASYASLNISTHKNISTSGVLAGYDAEGDELTFEIVKYPEDGVVKMTDKSFGTYVYIPSEDYSGKDYFEYVVRDKYGNYSASARVSVTVSVPSVSVLYSDLDGSDIHTYAIDMTEEGIMNGVQVGEYFYFKPEDEVTRAEFVVTAMTALGIKNLPDVADTGFCDDNDIRPEMKGYISLAYSKGYISGIRRDGEIYFNPNETIKLSEAAVILSNIIGYSDPEIKPVFSDSASIPVWSERAVVSLHALGVIECGDGSVDASRSITRGSMAKLLSRAMFITGN
ncbi:MAG: S-layer homology domain-containing protein [Clostridia bacterium]|nr:S-layer homology domain-containing protein [Clostridia bacterium]